MHIRFSLPYAFINTGNIAVFQNNNALPPLFVLLTCSVISAISRFGFTLVLYESTPPLFPKPE